MDPYSHTPYGGGAWQPGGQPQHGGHPVPQYQAQPQFALPEQWRYKPRRALWDSRALRAGALVALLALCGLVILAIVQQSVGTEGFVVGLALAVLPVPLVVGAFLWVDRVEPEPWRNLVFAFAWGACAATLVAIVANSWTTALLISTNTANPDTLGAAVVAPLVEESAKGAAVLLLFLFRRRDFDGIVDGVVIAGLTATGFAFTENILYLGQAFGEDLALGSRGLGTVTAVTFFMRVIMSPFAHPLFTCMTGVGFGLAAISRNAGARVLAPIGGLFLAMLLHGIWNGSSALGVVGFLFVYAIFMVPVFGLMVWLAVWSRNNELKTLAKQLPVYAMAGWISLPEPIALSSMKARKVARDLARRTQGEAGARIMREYQNFATTLAFLRAKADRGVPAPDFASREQELLHHLWQRKAVVQPLLAEAAQTVRPPMPPPGWHQPPPPYQPGYGYQPQPPHQSGYGHPSPHQSGYGHPSPGQGGYGHPSPRQGGYGHPGGPR